MRRDLAGNIEDERNFNRLRIVAPFSCTEIHKGETRFEILFDKFSLSPDLGGEKCLTTADYNRSA